MVSADHPKRQTMSIEEATISNMWEIAAIVAVLKRKGLWSQQEGRATIEWLPLSSTAPLRRGTLRPMGVVTAPSEAKNPHP